MSETIPPSFLAKCDDALQLLDGMRQRPWRVAGTLDSPLGACHEVKKCLLALVESAVSLAPAGDELPVTTAAVRDLGDVTTAIALAKRMKAWAQRLGRTPAPKSMWPQQPPQVVAQVQSKEPLILTLGMLRSMLASGGNHVHIALARCREMPSIRSHAARLGLCPPGEFSVSTVTAILDLLCVVLRIDQRSAYAMKLDAVAEFLAGRPNREEAGGADTDPLVDKQVSRWLTVSEVGRITGCNTGVITRAVDRGELKSNGETGRDRRIDAIDLARWQLARADKPEPMESNEAVQRSVKKNSRD
jgi:hypothetical protein